MLATLTQKVIAEQRPTRVADNHYYIQSDNISFGIMHIGSLKAPVNILATGKGRKRR